MGTQKNSVHVHNVTVSYQHHPAIHHIDVKIPFGETTAIIGPNGAGKSTLLKAIMGFLMPDYGEICLNITQDALSYLPQQSDIEKSMPLHVWELVATGFFAQEGMFREVSCLEYSEIIEALHYVGLSGFEKRTIGSLSNGQFQRALFARIIVQKAELILLDEPFNAVDAKTILDLCQLIQIWQKEGRTVVAVIHDFHMAKSYFTHTLMIARELIAFGKTKEVLTEQNIDRAYSTLLHWSEEANWCTDSNDVIAHN